VPSLLPFSATSPQKEDCFDTHVRDSTCLWTGN